jgi:hypothetical protein
MFNPASQGSNADFTKLCADWFEKLLMFFHIDNHSCYRPGPWKRAMSCLVDIQTLYEPWSNKLCPLSSSTNLTL